jgi:hypothetical protein
MDVTDGDPRIGDNGGESNENDCKNRPKKDGDVSPSLESVGSFEEHVRSQ